METFARASSREWQGRRRLLPVAAWSCAMATVLALATVAPVAAGKGDEAASMVGTAAVSRIAATSASAPPSSVNVTLICRPTPDPRACDRAHVG